MPVYHSSFKQDKEFQQLCKNSLLPLRTKFKGPAQADDSLEKDVVDEALAFFKANILFRNFEIKSGADRVLIYLTLFISQCLKKLETCRGKSDAEKQMNTLAISSFSIPGDKGYPMNGMVPAPADRKEADSIRAYYMQLRQELTIRLLERCWDEENDKLSKWWSCFSKRKFMNMSL